MKQTFVVTLEVAEATPVLTQRLALDIEESLTTDGMNVISVNAWDRHKDASLAPDTSLGSIPGKTEGGFV